MARVGDSTQDLVPRMPTRLMAPVWLGRHGSPCRRRMVVRWCCRCRAPGAWACPGWMAGFGGPMSRRERPGPSRCQRPRVTAWSSAGSRPRGTAGRPAAVAWIVAAGSPGPQRWTSRLGLSVDRRPAGGELGRPQIACGESGMPGSGQVPCPVPAGNRPRWPFRRTTLQAAVVRSRAARAGWSPERDRACPVARPATRRADLRSPL